MGQHLLGQLYIGYCQAQQFGSLVNLVPPLHSEPGYSWEYKLIRCALSSDMLSNQGFWPMPG